MASRSALIFLVCSIAVLACDEPNRIIEPTGDPTLVDVTPIVIDPDLCVPLALETDAATLDHVELSGDLLTVTVQYSGACEEHRLSLVAGPCFLESWPPQSQIFLVHEDPGDPCDAIVTEDRVFDLTPLKDTYLDSYGGRAATLILLIYEPGSVESYRPRPSYDVHPDD